MRNRRGAAHLEMVISFVFFITFISFLFIVLKPYESTVLTENIAYELEEEFADYVSTNYTRFFINLLGTGVNLGNQACFHIDLSPSLFTVPLTNSEVFDVGPGMVVKSNLTNTRLEIDGRSMDPRFFFVEVSPDFVDDDMGNNCNTQVPSSNYTLGSIFEQGVLSYEKIVLMGERYDSDYDILKSNLNIPEVFDFMITSSDLPELDMVRLVPDSEELFVIEGVYTVVNSTGYLTNARFQFTVW